jgi:hypothetical protein
VIEDGVRCYFDLDRSAGLSRLECYRRIVSQSDATIPGRHGTWFGGLGPTVTKVLEIAQGWRTYPAAIATILHNAGQ